MNCAHPRNGAPAKGGLPLAPPPAPPSRGSRGFTLLEMCMVLFIIALLFGVTMPAMQSAFVEQAVRKDGHQLALMVKTAMIQTAEQHRPYVIELTATSMALHPVGETAAAPDASDSADETDETDDTVAAGPVAPNVDVTSDLDSPNKLLVPDATKTNAWVAMPAGTEWVFQPGELCPATRIRLSRGDAWMEMSFNALTGNLENESYNFP